MELTKVERLTLINQMKILEQLYPDDATYYQEHRTALEKGFRLHYSWLFEGLHEEMSEVECREVLDVLDMYRALTFSIQRLDGGLEIAELSHFPFPGFDGNNEPRQLSYCRYFVVKLGRFNELQEEDRGFDSFNSHKPMLELYRGMLEVWKSLPDRINLSSEDIKRILSC